MVSRVSCLDLSERDILGAGPSGSDPNRPNKVQLKQLNCRGLKLLAKVLSHY